MGIIDDGRFDGRILNLCLNILKQFKTLALRLIVKQITFKSELIRIIDNYMNLPLRFTILFSIKT